MRNRSTRVTHSSCGTGTLRCACSAAPAGRCGNRLEDRAGSERRIAAFVASGLDDFRIRAWTVIRGAYLRSEPDYAERIRALLGWTSSVHLGGIA
jgi:hypothetical protein